MLLRFFLLVWLVCGGTAAHADDAADVRRLMGAGDLPAALDRARGGAEPRSAALRFLEGVILMELKRDDEALAAFRRLVEDYPELPDPYNNIALLLARAGRLDEARVALESALRNDPTHVLARTNLGEIYLRLAIRSWEAAASAAPADTALQRRLRLARELVAPAR